MGHKAKKEEAGWMAIFRPTYKLRVGGDCVTNMQHVVALDLHPSLKLHKGL